MLPAMLRGVAIIISVISVAISFCVLWVTGRLPASVPEPAPTYSLSELGQALRAVGEHGLVSQTSLAKERASLDAYFHGLESTAPGIRPERFATVDARLAYWLNVANAMALHEMADKSGSAARYVQSYPIGGERLTRYAVEQRYLTSFQDPRVWLAVFDGTTGGGVLDGAPFDEGTLDAQLADALRRYLRRKSVFSIDQGKARLAQRVLDHEAEFLQALPPERKTLLQVVWAFLPDACETETPDCVTRTDVDKACGNDLKQCQIVAVPDSTAQATMH